MRPGLLAAVALLAFAPAADAKIVVQESIAGVKLGMSAERVRDVLGIPRRVDYPKDEIQGSVKHYDYGLTDVYFSRGPDAGVYNVTTTSRSQRTTGGLGVGSTRAAVKLAYPRAVCQALVCSVGALTPGKRVTSFHLSAAMKVKRVSLGIVID